MAYTILGLRTVQLVASSYSIVVLFFLTSHFLARKFFCLQVGSPRTWYAWRILYKYNVRGIPCLTTNKNSDSLTLSLFSDFTCALSVVHYWPPLAGWLFWTILLLPTVCGSLWELGELESYLILPQERNAWCKMYAHNKKSCFTIIIHVIYKKYNKNKNA